jgi:predicted transcriptional regulator
MNKKEIRKEIISEGMYSLIDCTYILTSQEIDLIVDKIEAKINYTRCSLRLKDKKTITFDEFAKENNYKQNFLYFYRDGKTFKPSEIMKRYKTYLLSL